MTTAVQQDDLKTLGRLLRNRLQAEAVLPTPFQVQCAFKNEDLLILVQHAPPTLPDPSSIFTTLQQAIQALQPLVPKPHLANVSAWEQAQQIRIFLRVTGQQQPYAAHDFTMKTRVFSHPNASDLENILALEGDDNQAHDWEYRSDEGTPPESGSKWTTEPYSDNVEPSEGGTVASPFIDDSAPELEVESKPRSRKQRRRKGTSPGVPLPVLAIGSLVAGILSFGAVYVLTRPCVIGACIPLQTAQQLGQESGTLLRRARSVQELTTAQQQLAQATQQLKSIPPWSGHYSSAQNLLQDYSTQSQKLDGVLTAFAKATEAAQKSQNPPHTAQEWQQVYSLWNESISGLRQVTPENPGYSIAQQRLQDYQLNLAIINQRIKTEQQAEQRLKEAKDTAQVAESRQANARSLDSWQQVFASWQTAVNTLTTIPPTTTAYKEAQDLLVNYRPKLATARDRKTKEQISANNYNQAVSLAALAKRLEQQGQWSQAVATWRQASTFAQQVPNNTFYYNQSQPLIDAYANALKQAEDSLRMSLVLQKARLDLNRTCSGAPRICDYTVTNEGIKVYLTPSYVNKLIRTAATADISGDYNTAAGLQDHIQTLQAALEAISENANLPLALYDHRRQLIGTHAPRR